MAGSPPGVEAVRSGRNPLADGGIVSLLASAEQLATLHEAQALMSLLEGHSDVVMSSAATAEIPGAKRFARVLSERRTSTKGVAKLLQQFIGIDAKLRQYEEGERFVEAVQAEGGDELLAKVWSRPGVSSRLWKRSATRATGSLAQLAPHAARLSAGRALLLRHDLLARTTFPSRARLSTARSPAVPDSLALLVLAVSRGL
jgi:hypothetical protein